MKLRALWRRPRSAFRSAALLAITYLPGDGGNWLRYQYYRRRLKRCGTSVTIDVGVLIDSPERISIGNDVHIDKYCVIATGSRLTGRVLRRPNPFFHDDEGELLIGDHVHIAHGCIVMAYGGITIADHCTLSAGTKLYSLTNLAYDPDDKSKVISIMPYEQAPFLASPIVLERNVWVGLNGIIMPGVRIGPDSFAVSNSLVMHSFEANSYIQGQPARRVRPRFVVPTH